MRCSFCDKVNLDGFAIGSLVLGVVGVVLSPILLGGLLAIAGVALATVHLRRRRPREKLARWGRNLSEFALGLAVACGTYAVTNPYLPINLLFNRPVLSSNFGNSVAMYEGSTLVGGASGRSQAS